MLIICFVTLSGCQLFDPKSNSKNNTPATDSANNPTETPNPNSKPDTSQASDSNENSSDSGENTPDSDSSPYKIEDYYPFNPNTLYTYEGTGNEYASYTLWVDYIKDNKIQQRINNGGTEQARVMENKDGELKIIFSREESYYREDFTSKKPNKDEVLLKEPLIKGTSWTLSDGRKMSITNTEVDISTPSGSYKALEVTTKGPDSEQLDYYVLNEGLVKSIYKSKDMEVTSALAKVEKNASLTQDVEFYFPNNVSDKISLEKRSLTFKTNDMTKRIFEKEFKTAPKDELIKLMGPNVKINSLYLNNDGSVYVDFTENFVTEMNLGSGYEGMVLQSITNTLGRYYGAKKVYITLDSKPYGSGHIIMEKGEYFKVDTSTLVED